MNAGEFRPSEPKPEIEALSEARCPECDSEEIERIEETANSTIYRNHPAG